MLNQYVSPAMAYGCETCISTTKLYQKLLVTRRAIDRPMLNLSKRDKKTKEWITQQTKVTDIIIRTKRLKRKWADHVARQTHASKTREITAWYPRDGKKGENK